MQANLTGYILAAENVEMDDQKNPGQKVKMIKLTLLDNLDGTSRVDWVTAEKPKGFNPKLVAKVVGTEIIAHYKKSVYDGVEKTTLDSIGAVED